MADDMGWGDGHYNGGNARTPNLDAIASSANSIVFNRFYAENVCSPSRASVLTGRVPDRACIWTANSNGLARTSSFTLADAARAGGLKTAHFGKWHVGAFSSKIYNRHMSAQGQEVSGPLQHGYDFLYSSQPPAWAHINSNCGCCAGRNQSQGCLQTPERPPGSAKITAKTTCVDKYQIIEGNALKGFNEECDNYYYASSQGVEGIAPVRGQLSQDDSKTIGDAVVDWIGQVANESFMATVWFHTPHQNFAATEQWLRLYDDTNHTAVEKLYYADITGMDHEIGRIRQKLVDLDLRDTALFFTADNGPEHNTPGSAGGLTGRKRDLTEGGIRNPGLLEWPARVRKNARTEFAAKIVDYLPTLMDALGIDEIEKVRQARNPGWPLDGMSLLPVIDAIASGEQPSTAQRSKPLGWVTQHAQGGKANTVSHQTMQSAWMVGDMKLYLNRSLQTDNFTTHLFNISSDPSESTNLSGDSAYARLLRNMTQDFKEWAATVDRSRTATETNCNLWDPKLPS